MSSMHNIYHSLYYIIQNSQMYLWLLNCGRFSLSHSHVKSLGVNTRMWIPNAVHYFHNPLPPFRLHFKYNGSRTFTYAPMGLAQSIPYFRFQLTVLNIILNSALTSRWYRTCEGEVPKKRHSTLVDDRADMLWLPSMTAAPFALALAWFWKRLWRHSTVYMSGGMSLSSMRAPSRRGGYCSLQPKSASWKKNWAQSGRCDISWNKYQHVLWEPLPSSFLKWITSTKLLCTYHPG
jgi:hypothetical protein